MSEAKSCPIKKTSDDDHEPIWDDLGDHNSHLIFEKQISIVQFQRLNTQFEEAGYREGVISGKQCSLQSAFDHGFSLGVKRGKQLGLLRGRASALLQLSIKSNQDEIRTNQLRNLIRKLNQFKYNIPIHQASTSSLQKNSNQEVNSLKSDYQSGSQEYLMSLEAELTSLAISLGIHFKRQDYEDLKAKRQEKLS